MGTADIGQIGGLLNHGVLGIVVVQVIDWLKQAKWASWITDETVVVNRVLGLAAAAAVVAGMDWQYQAANGTLTVTGLTVTGVMNFLGEFIKQWSLQQAAYKGLYSGKGNSVNGGNGGNGGNSGNGGNGGNTSSGGQG